MKSDQIERVFGRGRLKMATGEHVEVFREAVGPGQRRRYTKRFLDSGDADFGQWTEREWRILARLIGHGIRSVPDVVQFDGGAQGGMRRVQTYDAGVTVDQWATLLPVVRDDVAHRHVFEDCAHWWALAHHCLAALDEIHALQLVHLDVKADNICIPYGPPDFEPPSDAALHVAFERLALIDFAFSLVSGERLATPLPIGWQKDYDYQSPRLLRALDAGRAGDMRPTQQLDWRCDFYSLAAMLRRYLPDDTWARTGGAVAGWTTRRYDEARALVYRLRDHHDRDLPAARPHRVLMEASAAMLAEPDLARSLAGGWWVKGDAHAGAVTLLSTPLTRIAVTPVAATRATSTATAAAVTPVLPAVLRNPRRHTLSGLDGVHGPSMPPVLPRPIPRVPPRARRAELVAALAAFCALAAPAMLDHPGSPADAQRLSLADAPAPRAEASVPPRAEAPVPPRADAPAPRAEASVPPRADAPAPRADRATPAAIDRAPGAADTGARARYPINRIAIGSGADKAPRSTAGGSPPSHVARDAERVRSNAVPATRAIARTPARTVVAQVAPSVSTEAAAPRESQAVVAAATPALSASVPEPNASIRVADAAVAPAAPMSTPPGPSTTPAHTQPMPRASTGAVDKPRRADPWRVALHDVLKLFGPMVQRAAPVEERATPTPGRAPAPPEHAVRPAPVERTQPAERVNELALARHGESTPAAIASDAMSAPSTNDQARASADALAETRARTAEDDLGVQARRMLRDSVPRVAAQASADVYRVLWAAAAADSAAGQRSVVDASYVPWRSERAYPVTTGSDERARRLHEDAKRAYAAGRDAEALDLLLRGLAVNPRDPDVAGFLAFLHLRMHPGQPETARQLALHALAFSGARRSLRLDDWHTLAVASALSGRDDDATRALLVELALSDDAERICRAAQQSYATYGERLRNPVEALMRRVQSQGRDQWAPACTWPGYRTMARAP
ncbi:MAG TPA: hypothetical protein VLR71_16595 [Casimicrobiaceae bacterium]|nr:hypothetical protein [Casimicrobiaceae bacterium]